MIKALERTFILLDKEGKGYITWDGLELFIRSLGLFADQECRRQKRSTTQMDLTQMRVGKAFLKTISIAKTLYGTTITDIDTLFYVMDLDSSGTIDMQELRTGLRRLDVGLTLWQEEAFLSSVDINGDGKLDLGEFHTYLHSVKKTIDEEEQRKRLRAGSALVMKDIVQSCRNSYTVIASVCTGLRKIFQIEHDLDTEHISDD